MSTNTILPVKEGDILGALQGFLGALLENQIVDALLVPLEIGRGRSLAQTLVQDPAYLKGANPFSPVMPVNSATLVSQLTGDRSFGSAQDRHSHTPEVQKLRMENLIPFLADHPHYCLTCAQREGCSRTQCSSNVPENERCCPQLGHCEVQKVAEYVGISEKIPIGRGRGWLSS